MGHVEKSNCRWTVECICCGKKQQLVGKKQPPSTPLPVRPVPFNNSSSLLLLFRSLFFYMCNVKCVHSSHSHVRVCAASSCFAL
jgi:hypothetical protein